MKKLSLVLLVVFLLGLGFQACDDSKTYAEMKEDEDKAIDQFIREQGFSVISQSEYLSRPDSMTAENEFVQLASGVYMNIVDRGSDNPLDTVKNNDEILVRFLEKNLLQGDTLSNLEIVDMPDMFRYTVTSSSILGIFTEGLMRQAYGTSVPAGWLVPLEYVRDGAHVRLIVPSEMGHNPAMQYVYPYYYDIRKYQIWK